MHIKNKQTNKNQNKLQSTIYTKQEREDLSISQLLVDRIKWCYNLFCKVTTT